VSALRALAAAAALALLGGVVLALHGCGGAAHRARSSTSPTGSTAPTHFSTTTGPSPQQRVANFGADFSAMFFDRSLDAASVDRELAAAASDGLGLARANPLWERTEPQPPRGGGHVYDWRFDDFIASRFAAHGFKWIAVLAYAPGWASVAPAQLHGAPRSPADFAAYAGALSARYRGQIAAYEIWNEENSPIFWTPTPDPSSYAQLYLAARAAIHRADPGVPVLVGGLANGTSFLSRLLSVAGVAGQIDGVAVHPYGANPLTVLAGVRDYRVKLRSLGAGDVPLYVTEYGWSTQPLGNPTYAPPSMQGPFIADVAQALLRSDCNVRAVIFYAWTTAERNPSDRDQWYGVASASGAPTAATEAVAQASRGLLAPSAPVRLCG
jgi:polysaccharide biosynthesis protein PslG